MAQTRPKSTSALHDRITLGIISHVSPKRHDEAAELIASLLLKALAKPLDSNLSSRASSGRTWLPTRSPEAAIWSTAMASVDYALTLTPKPIERDGDQFLHLSTWDKPADERREVWMTVDTQLGQRGLKLLAHGLP